MALALKSADPHARSRGRKKSKPQQSSLDASRLLQGILDNYAGGVSVFDENLQMILCNDKQKQLLDYPAALFAKGLPKLEQIHKFNVERGEYGKDDAEKRAVSRLLESRRIEAHTFERQRPGGIYIETKCAPLASGGLIVTCIDVTDRKRDQEMIGRLARHDVISGLPNRLVLQDRMQIGLARVERGDKLALLYLDIDRFKSVNDTLGHPVGNALLQAVGKRLKRTVRATDTVAHLGGDEFAIILVGVTSPSGVETVARRVIDAISTPFKIGKHAISIGTSIGIAMAPSDGIDTEVLIKNAEMALYRTKSNNKGTFSFFEKSMNDRIQARHDLYRGMRDALASDGFELHYQPIINIKTGRTIGCEALIRWSHPDRGLIPAAEFIPVAEDTGLISEIGDWVLRTACKEAQRWPADVSVSVNISAAQLRGQDLVATVMGSLDGLPPSRLILEITESMLMQESEMATYTLERLRSNGIRFALDDFGTGFSSLSYLQKFRFDKLKIDRSFVSAITNEERSATLRRAITQLGKNLGMVTVAEGVETVEQLNALKREGCIEAQGYLISRPVPCRELARFFSTPQITDFGSLGLGGKIQF